MRITAHFACVILLVWNCQPYLFYFKGVSLPIWPGTWPAPASVLYRRGIAGRSRCTIQVRKALKKNKGDFKWYLYCLYLKMFQQFQLMPLYPRWVQVWVFKLDRESALLREKPAVGWNCVWLQVYQHGHWVLHWVAVQQGNLQVFLLLGVPRAMDNNFSCPFSFLSPNIHWTPKKKKKETWSCNSVFYGDSDKIK